MTPHRFLWFRSAPNSQVLSSSFLVLLTWVAAVFLVVIIPNVHAMLEEEGQITTTLEENIPRKEEKCRIEDDSIFDDSDSSYQDPESDSLDFTWLPDKHRQQGFPKNILEHLFKMLFLPRLSTDDKDRDHWRNTEDFDVTKKKKASQPSQQQYQHYTTTPSYIPLKFFDVHRRFAKVKIPSGNNNNGKNVNNVKGNHESDESDNDGLIKLMTEPTVDDHCYPGMVLQVFQRVEEEEEEEEEDVNSNDNIHDKENGETCLESTTTAAEKNEEDPQAKSSVEILERSYTLLEPVHLELGVVPRHFLDYAYNPVLGREDHSTISLCSSHVANSVPNYSDDVMSSMSTLRTDHREQVQNTKGDTHSRKEEGLSTFQEIKVTNDVAITSREEGSWWSWWFPYANSWWKPHGLSRSDFTMGKSPFAAGSHGEVWKGRRVCRKGDDVGRPATFLSGRQKQRLYRSIEDEDECDELQPLVLKRLRINRGYKLLEAGLREVYFGNLIRNQLEMSQRDLFTAYVDHFFREVPRRMFGRLQESKDLELWIVFEDAGPSLRSYLYTATIADGFIMYQHSTLWTQLRTMTFEKPLSQKVESSPTGSSSHRGLPDIGRKVLRVVLYKILSAAAILHQKGIVHRDIKPSNIMCNGDTLLKDLFAIDKIPIIECRLGDFSSGWDHYTAEHLYTKGPSPWEQTDEYAPPESYLGPTWVPFSREKPQSYDSWSIGVTILELLLGTPNVFTVDQRTSALLTHKMKKAGASDDEVSRALYLAALSQFCIYVPSYNVSHPQRWPLGSGDPLHETAMAKDSCTLHDFHRALRARDPLGIGFDASTDLLLHLVWQLLAWDPNDRVTAEEALQHPYFTSPNETLEALNLIPGFHNALESQMLDPRMDFYIGDDVHEFVCPHCGRVFHDWRSCHQHANTRKHAKFCIYDHKSLPTCLNAHSMLPEHPTSGYCDLQGRRPTIEDFHSIHLHPDHQFYGIFDGHSEC
jgi:serine/threonine protein kinase